MLDSRLLCGRLIVSYVKDLKIGMTKLFIKQGNKLALIEQFLTEHPALNYNAFNVIMALQTLDIMAWDVWFYLLKWVIISQCSFF